MSDFEFWVDGQHVIAPAAAAHESLLHFLRARGFIALKEGCAEGECGACAIVQLRRGVDGEAKYVSVNSCLLLVGAAHSGRFLTAAGMADADRLHPVQQAMVDCGGSQCGFCTPGFISSMFAEYYRTGRETPDEHAIGGNLCRCTGYRPIRDALRSLPMYGEIPPTDRHLQVRAGFEEVSQEVSTPQFARPTSLAEVFRTWSAHPDASLLAGGTDLGVQKLQRDARFSFLMDVTAVAELNMLVRTPEQIEIGAAVSLSDLEALHSSECIEERLLSELWPLFASRLIRNRATLGGNLGNASPIGDSPPVLLALDAEVVLASSAGERVLPLHEFFLGYRKTALQPQELIKSVRIQKRPWTTARFYKVSKRVEDDISSVAAAFALRIDNEIISEARLAFGGVAATPARALPVEAMLIGRPWSKSVASDVVDALRKSFEPLSDHRASAAYRKDMTARLFQKFAFETGVN